MVTMEITIDVQVEKNRFIWRLPKQCRDLTLNWRDLFDLGDNIGENAFVMVPSISSPEQDENEANEIEIRRTSTENITLFFPKDKVEFNWSREVALVVAERFAAAAEKIAEELVKAGKVQTK